MPFVPSRRAVIYYEFRGASGPPLVLLRGYSSSIRTWNGVDHDLGSDHHTLVLDNRGTGRSTSPSGTYRVAEMARDVVAVMRHVGFDTAHIVGTSLGGMIAQELALRFPERVRSLVLAATAPGSKGTSPITTRGMMTLAAAAMMPSPIRSQLTARATLSPPNRHKLDAPAEPGPARRRSNGSLAGLIGQAFAIFQHQAADRLGTVRAPTLIIHGTSDVLIDPSHAQHLVRLIPNARLETWAGAGHDLATEDAKRLAESVRRHVRDAAGSR
jgi:3-oxoadipate enol-lactonase